MWSSRGNILRRHPCFLSSAIQRRVITGHVAHNDEAVEIVRSLSHRHHDLRLLAAVLHYVDLLAVADRLASLRSPNQKPLVGVDVAGDGGKRQGAHRGVCDSATSLPPIGIPATRRSPALPLPPTPRGSSRPPALEDRGSQPAASSPTHAPPAPASGHGRRPRTATATSPSTPGPSPAWAATERTTAGDRVESLGRRPAAAQTPSSCSGRDRPPPIASPAERCPRPPPQDRNTEQPPAPCR